MFYTLSAFRRRNVPVPIFIFLILFLMSFCSCEFDAKTKFTWLDSSCDGKQAILSTAGQNVIDLAAAARDAIRNAKDADRVVHKTLKVFFGLKTEDGLVVANNYGRIAQLLGDEAKDTGYSLYCDGSAFEFVTEYQEDDDKHKKGDPVEEKHKEKFGGLWYAKRRKPGDKALYIESEKRDAYCVHPTKKNKDNTPMEAMGVSTTRGKHIVLCPAAFKNPQDLAASKDTVYPDNTEIGRFDGLSATLLHEVTHCIFGTLDYRYGAMQCIGLATNKNGASRAQKNADSWVWFAIATYFIKNAWYTTLAQPISGPSAAAGHMRRAIEARMVDFATRVAGAPTTLIKRAEPQVPKPTVLPSGGDSSCLNLMSGHNTTTGTDSRSVPTDVSGDGPAITAQGTEATTPVTPGSPAQQSTNLLDQPATTAGGQTQSPESTGEPVTPPTGGGQETAAQLPPPNILPIGSSTATIQTGNPSSSSSGSTASGALTTKRPTGPTQTDAITTADSGETESPKQTTKQDSGRTDVPSVTAALLPAIKNSSPIKPKSFSTLPPGVISNTIILTKDSDGRDVEIPFLWHCWFCGGGGFGLFGFGTKPGIYPPPVPPPPEIPKLPTITMGKDRKPTPAPEKENNEEEDDPSPSDDDNQTTELENQTTADFTQTDSNPTTTKSSSSSTVQNSASSTSSDSRGYTIETAGYFEEDWFGVDTAAVSKYLATITGGSVPATTGATTSATSTNVLSTPGSNKPTSTGGDVPPSTEAPAPSSTKEPDSTIKPPDPTTKEEPPPPPTVAPVDPPSQPSCYPSPSGHYQDSHEDNMRDAVSSFCDVFAKDVIHDATVDVNKTGWADADDQFWDANDPDDDIYENSIKNIDGCMPGDAGFDLAEPVAGQKCYDILVGNWRGCTGNKGRGGVTQAGCLSYSLRTLY